MTKPADELLDLLVTSCVVVTAGTADDPHGCLVASVMPVGVGTSQLVIGMSLGGATTQAVLHRRRFAINLLARDDLATARHFGARAGLKGHLAGWSWSPGITGVPVLDGAVGCLELESAGAFEIDACWLIAGRIVAVRRQRDPGGATMTIEDARQAQLEPAHVTRGTETPR